jgi:hypothetical protein
MVIPLCKCGYIGKHSFLGLEWTVDKVTAGISYYQKGGENPPFLLSNQVAC